ncbi:MAG: serine/threonine-protein kinase, partial [Gemmatimonadota bacterium]|nr:serine/threonine-protein kinase [Gemmatimonadota bacterium]
VMPLVDGESLRERLARQGQLPIREAVRIARDIADALAYAHRQGIIHRDIKPGNILIEDGHAVLADFGIATLTEHLSLETLTETGVVPGTPHYMAPEQLEPDLEIDHRADIYALGCVLYEMLAGEPPIPGARASVVLARKMAGEIGRLRVARPSVPEGLEQIVHRALARVPADRYETADELAEALETHAIAGAPPATEPVAASAPARSLAEKMAVAATVVVGGVALTAAIGFLTTTAFDIKVQMPDAFRPSSTRHLTMGGRALLPVAAFGLFALGLFFVARFVAKRVGAGIMKLPVFAPATDAFERRVVTPGNRFVRAVRSATLGDAFFVSLVAVSLFVVTRFGDLLSVLWTSEAAILGCEHKAVHRSFMISMVVLIVGFGTIWLKLFPWLERRAPGRPRASAARWGSLAWLIGLLVLLTVPWRIIYGENERIRLDGRPAYLLQQTEATLLVVGGERGFARVVDRGEGTDVERLGVHGSPFEGRVAFESGLPGCEAITVAAP